jgi:hypothetical protein
MAARHSNIRRSPDPQPSFAGIRRYDRRPVQVDVFVQDADGWEIPLEATDISPVGIFVESDFLFDVGDEHTLIFRAPDGEFVFRIPGRVVRVSDGQGPDGASNGNTPGMAYEFIGTDAETWTKLCSMVAQK